MSIDITLAAESVEDPYAGFGVEEVAAPLQTDDLEYDEGFQVHTVEEILSFCQ